MCQIREHDILSKLMLPVAALLSLILAGCASSLYTATQNNDLAEVQRQLAAGADINEPKAPPLLAAAEQGNIAMVKFLLSKGAVPDIRDQKTGNTPFIQAASRGHCDVMTMLLNTGKAEVDERNAAGNTALMEASDNRHLAAVELLLSKKADINATNAEGWVPLFFAVRHGHTAIAEFLLNHGAELQTRNAHGFTALLIAAAYGHTASVVLLLEHNADIDAVDTRWKQTALHWATVNGHTAVAKILLEHGIDITPRNVKGYTARQGADIYGRNDIGRLIDKTPPSFRENMLANKALEYRKQTISRLKNLPFPELIRQDELDNKLFVPLQTAMLNMAKQQMLPEFIRNADKAQLAELHTAIEMQLANARNQIEKYQRDIDKFNAPDNQTEAAACKKAIADLQIYQNILRSIENKLE